jgi:WD40 repeat protein
MLCATVYGMGFVASSNGSANVRMGTRRQLLAFAGDPSWIGSIQFSADGRRFLTIGGEGYKVWSAARGVLLFSQPLASAWFAQAALSADGNFLYTADSVSPLAEVWAVRSRSRLHTLDLHTGSATAVALDPSGARLLLASLDGTAEVWSTAMNPRRGAELIGEVPYSVAFVPGSAELVVAGGNAVQGRAQLLSAEGAVLKTFDGHPVFARSAAIDASGRRLATGAYDGSGVLWDLRDGARIGSITEANGDLLRMEFSPDGGRLATASYGDQWDGARGAGTLRDGATGAPIGTLTHEQPIYRMAFSPDGGTLATASEDGTVKLWDSVTGRLVRTLAGHQGPVTSARFGRDGTRIVSAGQDSSVRIWDAATGQALAALENPAIGWVIDAVFAPDGASVAVGTREGNVLLWSPGATGYRVLKGHAADVVAVKYLHDGRLLLTQGWDGTIRAWDPRAGLEVARVAAPGGVINSMDVSDDESLLAAGSSTYYLGVWDLALEGRPFADVAADLACRSLWVLNAGALAPRADPAGCRPAGR